MCGLFVLRENVVQPDMADSIARHASNTATTVSYTASGAAMWLGLTTSEWAALVGVLCAVITCGVNWWYRHQEYLLSKGRSGRGR